LEANRVRAELKLVVAADGSATRLRRLREGGGYRIKFPTCDHALDAVIVNVGGGLAGGDVVRLDVEAMSGAQLWLSTQAAEKVYRSAASSASVTTRLRAAGGSRVSLAPQETIFFDGARLERTLDVEMAADAQVLLGDMTVFGRLAMGERVGRGFFRDRWRVRREGELVHADDVRMEGDLAGLLDRPASGDGARASLSIAWFSAEAETDLEMVRTTLGAFAILSAASAWDGKLIVRALARDPAPLRAAYGALTSSLGGFGAPRYW
jgi:urease accessory protein